MCALIFMSSYFPSVIRSCFAYERERTPESFPHHKSLIWSLSVTQFKNWLVSTFNLLLSAFHSETFVSFNDKVLNTLTLPADDSHPCDLCHFLGLMPELTPLPGAFRWLTRNVQTTGGKMRNNYGCAQQIFGWGGLCLMCHLLALGLFEIYTKGQHTSGKLVGLQSKLGESAEGWGGWERNLVCGKYYNFGGEMKQNGENNISDVRYGMSGWIRLVV